MRCVGGGEGMKKGEKGGKRQTDREKGEGRREKGEGRREKEGEEGRDRQHNTTQIDTTQIQRRHRYNTDIDTTQTRRQQRCSRAGLQHLIILAANEWLAGFIVNTLGSNVHPVTSSNR
tara:strand:+ start:145 stop:498 length:354 start_codon:yes stop_codon:yes gene_type:complete